MRKTLISVGCGDSGEMIVADEDGKYGFGQRLSFFATALIVGLIVALVSLDLCWIDAGVFQKISLKILPSFDSFLSWECCIFTMFGLS